MKTNIFCPEICIVWHLLCYVESQLKPNRDWAFGEFSSETISFFFSLRDMFTGEYHTPPIHVYISRTLIFYQSELVLPRTQFSFHRRLAYYICCMTVSRYALFSILLFF